MALVNKGLYYLEGTQRRIAYTLFECLSNDNINFNGMHIESSVLCNTVNNTFKYAGNTTFPNSITLGKVTGYSYYNFTKSGLTSLAWGGIISTASNRVAYAPLYVIHATDTDDYYINRGSVYYNPIPTGNPTLYDAASVSVTDVANGNPGYFIGTFVYNYNYHFSDFSKINPDTQTAFYNLFKGGQPFATDPYNSGGTTSPGGGGGDFDLTSDPIDFPPLPSIGATDTGFVSIFNPTIAQLKALANYMWSNPLFDVSAWKKIFADPMDAILGLSLIPVAVPDGAQKAITVGNIATDVIATTAAQQFVEIQCGTVNVNEFWGAYLDYAPYTKIEIYLPYCGTHQLNIDDVMNKTVEVRYHVDILSGACCAYVKCGDSVLYTFIGQCSSSIPITGGDFTNVINGVLSAATAIGSMVATGGASAPLAVPSLANTAMNDMKPNVEKSGSISGTGALLAIQKPYLILTRPNQALPENQNKYTGYPSFITAKLSDISGYTEIEKIHVDDVPCTESELVEIETLLKQGVIL